MVCFRKISGAEVSIREIKAMRADSKTHSAAFTAWGAKVFTGFLVLVSYSSCSGGLLNEFEEE